MKVTAHFHLSSKLRINGVRPLLLVYAFVGVDRGSFYFSISDQQSKE
jgi:hypothetical protein